MLSDEKESFWGTNKDEVPQEEPEEKAVPQEELLLDTEPTAITNDSVAQQFFSQLKSDAFPQDTIYAENYGFFISYNGLDTISFSSVFQLSATEAGVLPSQREVRQNIMTTTGAEKVWIKGVFNNELNAQLAKQELGLTVLKHHLQIGQEIPYTFNKEEATPEVSEVPQEQEDPFWGSSKKN